jgi:hypothetical protein
MREFSRERHRQISRINIEFWSIVRGFEESLFGVNIERLETDKIFLKYEDVWKRFCRHWDIGYSRIVWPNPDAFREYVTKDEQNTILE